LKLNAAICSTIIILFLVFNHCSQQKNFQLSKDSYLDQKPPGNTPELFAPEIISTKDNAEYGGHFSPDFKEFYFTRYSSGRRANLWVTTYEHDKWTPPQIVPFMETHPGAESCISPDGNRFYFLWMDTLSESFAHDIYMSKRSNNKWGTPYPLTQTDLGSRRICPSVASNGNLYFSGDYDSPGQKDIYCSTLVNGEYTTPENLGPSVNSEYNENHVFVAPDESYVLFDSHQPNELGHSDIYISYHLKNGTWSEAQNLGATINSEHYDWYPQVTPDGKFIMFARTIANSGIDIYWVDAKVIQQLKPIN